MLTLGRLFNRVQRDEQGSLLVAIAVVMIVTVSLVITFNVAGTSLNTARRDQSRTSAFQQANAGIDRALYRLDRADLPTSTVGTYVPTTGLDDDGNVVVTGFTESVAVNGETFAVSVAQDPPGQSTFWKVRSTGSDRAGVQRQAIATVQATPLFRNAFFTLNTFDLRGQQATPVAYSSKQCVDPRPNQAAPGCSFPYPVPGRLGTNADIVLATSTRALFKQRWEGVNMYGRATQAEADAACDAGNCGTTPFVRAVTERLEFPADQPPLRVPASATTCPWSGGTIGASGLTTVIAPGDYWCPDGLHLRGIINVSGTDNVRIWVGKTLTAGGTNPGDRTIVNEAQRPKRFQLYFPELPTGTTNTSTICNSEIWGLLYTPGLQIDCGGTHQPGIYGSVIANMHNTGGNHFDFHWDVDSFTDLNNGLFVVKNWRECPPGQTDC